MVQLLLKFIALVIVICIHLFVLGSNVSPFGLASIGDFGFNALTCLMSIEGQLLLLSACLSGYICCRINFSVFAATCAAIQFGTIPIFATYLWSTSADFLKLRLIIVLFLLFNLLAFSLCDCLSRRTRQF